MELRVEYGTYILLILLVTIEIVRLQANGYLKKAIADTMAQSGVLDHQCKRPRISFGKRRAEPGLGQGTTTTTCACSFLF